MKREEAVEQLARLWHSLAVEACFIARMDANKCPRYAVYKEKAEREVGAHYPEFSSPMGEHA